MLIGGLLKTTLLDYPGEVACTIFTLGCNMHCPYCHNAELIDGRLPDGYASYTMQDIFDFLRKRAGILGGVAITGGEPTLQPDLIDFIKDVRALGYKIKLDTNGYRPDVLEGLIADRLIDYIAMDIKSSRSRYASTCGLSHIDISLIDRSVQLLKSSPICCEFRTTVAREFIGEDDIHDIADWLAGSEKYFLQNFKDSAHVPIHDLHPLSESELEAYINILSKKIPHVSIRSI